MPADKGAPLSSVQPEQEAAVRRVHAQDLGLPQDLGELAPILGAHLKTLLVSPYDQATQVKVQGRQET